MYCIKCGTKLADGYLFCPNCGATNHPTVPPVNQTAPYGGAQQQQPAPYYSEPQTTPYGGTQPYPTAPPTTPTAPYGAAPQPAPYEETPQTIVYGQAPQPPVAEDVTPPQEPINAGEEHTALLDEQQPAVIEEPTPSADVSDIKEENTVMLEEPWQQEPQQPVMPEPAPIKEAPLPYNDSFDDQSTVIASDDNATVYADGSQGFNYNNSGYGNSYPSSVPPVYGAQNNYQSPDSARQPEKKVYRRTSVGVKILSVFLCILFFSFAEIPILIGSVRFSLTENRVREACRDGSVADVVIQYNGKEQQLADFIADGLIDSKTNLRTNAERAKINEYLKKSYVREFIEGIAVDYSNYFMRDVTPTKLNSDNVVAFMERLNEDFKKENVGFYMSQAYLDDVRKKVDNGELSFLSIDANGGAFKQHYHFDPHTITLSFSVLSLILSIVFSLIFLALIVLINRKNLPSSFKICGIALIVTGAVYLLSGIGLFILTLVKKIYLATALLQGFAIGMSIISLSLIIIGIVLIVIKKVMMKNAVVE